MNRRYGTAHILVTVLAFRQQNHFFGLGDQIRASYGIDPSIFTMLNKPDETPHTVYVRERQSVHATRTRQIHKIR